MGSAAGPRWRPGRGAMAGAMTPFPERAGAAASLQRFGQFVFASTSALIVGLTYDHTTRPMATTIAVSALLAFVCSRLLIVRAAPVVRR